MKKINRIDKIVLNECMDILAKSIKKMETKTDALLYFHFEDLLNKSLGTSINNSDLGKLFEDGKRVLSKYEIARVEYLELKKIIKNKDYQF